jgi:hypothetical protein
LVLQKKEANKRFRQDIISMVRYVFALTLLLVCNSIVAQKTDRAGYLKKATQAFDNYQYVIAAENFEQVINLSKKDSANDIKFKLADTYWKMRNPFKTLEVYKSIQSKKIWNEVHKIRFSELLARNDEYDSAANLLSQHPYTWAQEKADGFRNKNEYMKDSANWQISFISVNTGYSEFTPMLNGKRFLFNSNRPLNPSRLGNSQWDGYDIPHAWEILDTALIKIVTVSEMFKRKAGRSLANTFSLSDSDPLVSKLSNTNNELENKYFNTNQQPYSALFEYQRSNYASTAPAFTTAGKIYFSSTYTTNAKTNRLQIFEAELNNNGIRYPHPMSFNDTAYTAIHPTANADGSLIIYSTNKKGGKGGYDLFYTLKTESGFSLPRPIEPANTEMNEVFPTITADGWLYYSSDGLPGLGGLDIYRIKIDSLGITHGDIEHLSAPVNSGGDDFGWTQIQNGTKGYFSSDRLGDDNIYAFTYTPPAVSFNGEIEINDRTAIVTISIEDANEIPGKSIQSIQSGINNRRFQFYLKQGHTYKLVIRYKDKIPYSRTIEVNGTNPIQLPIIILL